MKKIIVFLFGLIFFNFLYAQKIKTGTVYVFYNPQHPINSFIPSKNIGGAIDGHFKGDIGKMLTPENIKAMESVGLNPISYRLRSELAGEVWHWNPLGKWSDSARHQGYWVSDSISPKPINISYGYRLPRRGNTNDQANDDGYSRICDGDTSTFWKSNPYLDTHYTLDSNKIHPQWVIIDFGRYRRVNAIRIQWGNPYAVSYSVDYANGNDPHYFDPHEPGIWYPFPKNNIRNVAEENKLIMISDKPIRARFIRVSMTQSSYTSSGCSNDIRDILGYAIKEIEAGLMDSKGEFHDWMHHSPDHNQTVIRVSSTDPWHTPKDLDSNIEQAGIDLIFKSGITAGQPALFPAALLYNTPDNVISLLKYLKEKNYPVEELEMGEEPEGQLIAPVDYAALYRQWGEMIKQFEPDMRMGGPGFASLSFIQDDGSTFTESKWTSEFLNYLKIHNSLNLFNFFSFEWYPFDNICAPPAPQLAAAPKMLTVALTNIQNNILPPGTPLYLTEYGYSAYEGKSEVEIEGALMYADILGRFIQMGGSKNFLYGYEPAFLQQTGNCGYGNNMIFGLGNNGKIKYKTASFYVMKMLTHFWAQPGNSVLETYPTACNIYNRKKQPLVSSYPLRKPNGNWSVMLINKDPRKSYSIEVSIKNTITEKPIGWNPQHLIQYSKKLYKWINAGKESYPSLSLPAETKRINTSKHILLPPLSITIVY